MFTTTLHLALSLVGAPQELVLEAVEDAPVFAEPVLLHEGDAPMGRGLLYPSPALFDVDADGTDELVMGDLVGKLWVSARVEGDDPTAWTEREPLKAADGNDLKFSNW